MKFGVREICNVVLKAKNKMTLGSRTFFKEEPVLYFDTLKTSSVEGAATTVYAQGGRGNARLMSWDGERTVTFTMEDALISAESFSVLAGCGLTKGESTAKVHTTAITNEVTVGSGETATTITLQDNAADPATDSATETYVIILDEFGNFNSEPYQVASINGKTITLADTAKDFATEFPTNGKVFVDYYTVKGTAAKIIDITPELSGHNFYLEADTLFRGENGEDLPAVFVIPNCRVQSNFTFTMASSGDPSSFTFTMDAFPDTVKGGTEKVFAEIIVVDENEGDSDGTRTRTNQKETE